MLVPLLCLQRAVQHLLMCAVCNSVLLCVPYVHWASVLPSCAADKISLPTNHLSLAVQQVVQIATLSALGGLCAAWNAVVDESGCRATLLVVVVPVSGFYQLSVCRHVPCPTSPQCCATTALCPPLACPCLLQPHVSRVLSLLSMQICW